MDNPFELIFIYLVESPQDCVWRWFRTSFSRGFVLADLNEGLRQIECFVGRVLGKVKDSSDTVNNLGGEFFDGPGGSLQRKSPPRRDFGPASAHSGGGFTHPISFKSLPIEFLDAKEKYLREYCLNKIINSPANQ